MFVCFGVWCFAPCLGWLVLDTFILLLVRASLNGLLAHFCCLLGLHPLVGCWRLVWCLQVGFGFVISLLFAYFGWLCCALVCLLVCGVIHCAVPVVLCLCCLMIFVDWLCLFGWELFVCALFLPF